jgi:uncharacterized protein YjbI with pentapeptide repeats
LDVHEDTMVNDTSVEFKKSTLADTHFVCFSLEGITFDESILKKCSISHSDMYITQIINCLFDNVSFNDGLYEMSSMENTTFLYCSFDKVELANTEVDKLYFVDSFFTNSIIPDNVIENITIAYMSTSINDSSVLPIATNKKSISITEPVFKHKLKAVLFLTTGV